MRLFILLIVTLATPAVLEIFTQVYTSIYKYIKVYIFFFRVGAYSVCFSSGWGC